MKIADGRTEIAQLKLKTEKSDFKTKLYLIILLCAMNYF